VNVQSLWFVVPVHARIRLASICLSHLRRTCDSLEEQGIEATAVVIADAENHDMIQAHRDFGFATIERDNRFLSRRFNDGIQMALDPHINRRPADYVVPCGSDDWVDWRLFTELPRNNTVYGFQRMAFVNETGTEMNYKLLNYPGGCGIRIYPRPLMKRVGYRPADEDRARGCDTSILWNLQQRVFGLSIVHRMSDPRQLVDWKSPVNQLNSYSDLERHRSEGVHDPFKALAGVYPDDLLQEMATHYGRTSALKPKVMA